MTCVVRRVLCVALLGSAFVPASAEDKKSLPNQAGNDDIELAGTVLLDRAEIQEALGADLGAGYAAVRIKITPKTGRAMKVSPDDFTLISRKDGERSSALTPGQIAGRGVMVVHKAERQPGGLGTVTNGPIWGGIGGARPRQMPGQGNGVGNGGSVEGGTAEATIDKEKGAAENPILGILKEKGVPEVDSKDPVEGLLYFTIEGKKLKPKDMALLYKGDAGRLAIDFK